MRSNPGRDERESHTLLDVASAHEAGLSHAQILSGAQTATLDGPAAIATETLAEGLQRKGMRFDPHELLLLQTAEHAGRLAPALRRLATQRAERASRHRAIRKRLSYPAFLLGFGLVVSQLGATATKTSHILPLALFAGVLGLLYLIYRYAIRAAHAETSRVPLLAPTVRNWGEIPYLRAMHGLYGAGVKLTEAHELALKTSPVEGVRMRLFQAGQRMTQDRTLAESLHEAGALHPETRQMLSAAEAAGDLEDAFDRAAERRQDELDRQSALLARAVVATVVTLVYGYLGYLVLSFWLGYYANLSSILGR